MMATEQVESWEHSTPSSSEGSDCQESTQHLQLSHRKQKPKRIRCLEDGDQSVPDKKGPWSAWEEMELIKRHREIGNKWATISRFLPGRSDNGVKNHWNSTLRSKSSARHQTLLWIYAKQVEAVAESKEGRARIFKRAKAEHQSILENLSATGSPTEELSSPRVEISQATAPSKSSSTKRRGSNQSCSDVSLLSNRSSTVPESEVQPAGLEKSSSTPLPKLEVQLKYTDVQVADDASNIPLVLGEGLAAVRTTAPIASLAQRGGVYPEEGGHVKKLGGSYRGGSSSVPVEGTKLDDIFRRSGSQEEDSLVQTNLFGEHSEIRYEMDLCQIYKEWSGSDLNQSLGPDSEMPHSPATGKSEACGFQFQMDDVPRTGKQDLLHNYGSSGMYTMLPVADMDEDGVDPTLIVAGPSVGPPVEVDYTVYDFGLVEGLLDPSPSSSFQDPLSLSYPGMADV